MARTRGQAIDGKPENKLLGFNDPDARVSGSNSGDIEATNRLKKAVQDAGGATAVGRQAGIPIATLKSFLNGRDVRRSALVAIADACGVSVEWLATGRGEPGQQIISAHSFGLADVDEQGTAVTTGRAPGAIPDATSLLNVTDSDYVAIPRYNITASAGGGALADHAQVVEYLAFSKKFLSMQLHHSSETLALIEARGDSMEPTIRDSDILTLDIRPNQPLENGRLYVIRVNDNLLVKRIELRLNSIVLHSDNKRYSPETITLAEADQLQLIGKVILVTAPPR